MDYIWLTTGKGEMFVGSDDIYEKLDCIILGKDERRKKCLKR